MAPRTVAACIAAFAVAFAVGLATRPAATVEAAADRGEEPDRRRETGPLPKSREVKGDATVLGKRLLYKGNEAAEKARDPVAISDLGVPVKEIMASRERNDAWARPVEKFLAKEIEAVFDAMMFEYEDLSIHCTDLACEVSFTVDSEIADAAFGRMQGFPAPLQQPFGEVLPDGRERIGMRLLYEKSWSSIDGFKRGYTELYDKRFPEGLGPMRDWFARGGTLDSPPPEDME